MLVNKLFTKAVINVTNQFNIIIMVNNIIKKSLKAIRGNFVIQNDSMGSF